jgi:AcrR family transcriptional regulator
MNTGNKSHARPETERRRTEILRAALDIFGAKGSTNGTLGDIANEVGMTHAGVLHHFGSKQRLLLEVLEFRDRDDVAGLADRHTPGGPALFTHLVGTAQRNSLRPGIVQAYTVLCAESVTHGHAAREYFEKRYRVLRNDVEKAFRELCARENVSDSDRIDKAAASILAVMDGLQLQWLLDPSVVDLADTTEFAIEAIVNGVVHPGPALSSYVHDAGPRRA